MSDAIKRALAALVLVPALMVASLHAMRPTEPRVVKVQLWQPSSWDPGNPPKRDDGAW